MKYKILKPLFKYIKFLKISYQPLVLLTSAIILSGCSDPSSSKDRFYLLFQSQGKQLKLHILDDDLVHLEWSGPQDATDPKIPRIPPGRKISVPIRRNPTNSRVMYSVIGSISGILWGSAREWKY